MPEISLAQYPPIQIWLSPTPVASGTSALGTQSNPLDASNEVNFDGILSGYFNQGRSNITFMLTSGTYYTLGGTITRRGPGAPYGGVDDTRRWGCLSNWKFNGAGMDQTVVKLVPELNSYTNAITQAYIFSSGTDPATTGVEIKDLTVDASWYDSGALVTQAFTQPPSGQSVTVTVSSTSWAVAGKYAYMETTDSHSGLAFYQVLSILDATHVQLQNLQGTTDLANGGSLTPGSTSGTAVWIGQPVLTSPIAVGGQNCVIQRVHVTNSGAPFYEGIVGIFIGGNGPSASCNGNLVSDCLIDDLWGENGWVLTLYQANGTVKDNNILSNGYHHGLGVYETSDSTFINNTVQNCAAGFFVDTGTNTDIQIVNNLFLGDACGIQLSAACDARFNISNNEILLSAPAPANDIGILTTGNLFDSVISNNEIILSGSNHLPVSFGLDCVNSAGTSGSNNIFGGNMVSSSLYNLLGPGIGYAYNNTNESGGPITFWGGASANLPDDAVKASGANNFTGSNTFSGSTTFSSGATVFDSGAITLNGSSSATMTLGIAGASVWTDSISNFLTGGNYDFNLYNVQNGTSALAINGNTDEVILGGNLSMFNGVLTIGPGSTYGRIQIGANDGTYSHITTIDNDRILRLESGDSNCTQNVEIKYARAISYSGTAALTVSKSNGPLPAHYIDFTDASNTSLAGYIDTYCRMSVQNLIQHAGNPNGVTTGAVGDLYQRTDGTQGSTLFVKESGTSGSTSGWNQVVTTGGTILTGSGTISFPSIAANTTTSYSIPVPNASVGDAVCVGYPPNPSPAAAINLIYDATVEAAGSVSLRAHNPTGTSIHPATGTFTVTVIKH